MNQREPIKNILQQSFAAEERAAQDMTRAQEREFMRRLGEAGAGIGAQGPQPMRSSRATLPALFALAAAALLGVLYLQFSGNDTAAPIHDYSADEEPENTKTPEIAVDSPMYRGNAARTGYYPGALGKFKPGEKNRRMVFVGSHDDHLYAFDAKTGEELWKVTTGNNVHSSPAVADGRVFVGSGDQHLYAFDAITGEELWKTKTLDALYSSPAVVDGAVFVGSAAFDADTGEELWKAKTGDMVYSSPAVADGQVFVASHDKHIYAFDADTGGELWKAKTKSREIDGEFSSPAVADGRMFVGSNDGHLYTLDAETGEELWKADTGFSVQSSPAVAKGVVFVGSRDFHLHAFDADTGEELWKAQTEGSVSSSPAVADGHVFVGSEDRRLYAFDAATGEELWKANTDNYVTSSPAVAKGVVFVGSHDCHLYAFDAATGEELWKMKTEGAVTSSPAVADFAAPEKHWVADDEPEPSQILATVTDSPMFRGNAARTGYYPGGMGKLKPGEKNRRVVFVGSADKRLYAFDAATGGELWNFATDGEISGSPVALNGAVCISSWDHRLYTLNAATGGELWTFATGHSIAGSPAVADDRMYFGSHDGRLYAVDANTGKELWTFATGGSDGILSSPAVANGAVYFGSQDNHLYAVDANTGGELWKFETGSDITSAPAVVNEVVYINSWDCHLYALNAATGEMLWRFKTTDDLQISSSPAVANGIVYFGSYDRRLYAVNADTGGELWRFETGGGIFSSPAVANGTVYFGSDDHHLYAVDADSGEELWRVQTGGSVSSSPAVANGVVYFGSHDRHLYAVNAGTGKEVWRAQTDGEVYSSPAVADFAAPGGAAHMIADDDEPQQPKAREFDLFAQYVIHPSNNSAYPVRLLLGSTDSGKTWKEYAFPAELKHNPKCLYMSRGNDGVLRFLALTHTSDNFKAQEDAIYYYEWDGQKHEPRVLQRAHDAWSQTNIIKHPTDHSKILLYEAYLSSLPGQWNVANALESADGGKTWTVLYDEKSEWNETEKKQFSEWLNAAHNYHIDQTGIQSSAMEWAYSILDDNMDNVDVSVSPFYGAPWSKQEFYAPVHFGKDRKIRLVKTTDGGKSWQWITDPFERREFESEGLPLQWMIAQTAAKQQVCLYAYGLECRVSFDKGETWQQSLIAAKDDKRTGAAYEQMAREEKIGGEARLEQLFAPQLEEGIRYTVLIH